MEDGNVGIHTAVKIPLVDSSFASRLWLRQVPQMTGQKAHRLAVLGTVRPPSSQARHLFHRASPTWQAGSWQLVL